VALTAPTLIGATYLFAPVAGVRVDRVDTALSEHEFCIDPG